MIHDMFLPECSKTTVAQEMRVLVTFVHKDQIKTNPGWEGSVVLSIV